MLVWSSILAAVLATGPTQDVAEPTVTVVVDSSRKELIVTAGPFDLPNMPPMEDHAMMDLGMSHDTPIQRFRWPIDGWLRGFELELEDSQGRPVPRDVIHHMIMVNFSRRMLLYPAPERLLGAGTETEDIKVPKTIGVPMKPGMDLGMYVAWHNDTGTDLHGVQMKLRMLWTPKNQNPPPVNALPIYMDVNLTVGGSNTFDVPPGRSEKAWEFTLPMKGRLLGVGGHLHDYGLGVRLEDAETGKVITAVEATRDSAGRVSKVSRNLFGVSGEGLKLKANHRYRVIGVYDNPTGETLVRGAMAHMAGLFTPEDLDEWPVIDPSNRDYQRDMASLQARGTGEGGHQHGGQGNQGGNGEQEHAH
ncbi:MAG TPA: hypothetical protein VG500_00915 [Gemmatimonadales bacterium]|jgi:hypothetical protein|nr:hypothetical protein [Gemmatimonadales bacterium]